MNGINDSYIVVSVLFNIVVITRRSHRTVVLQDSDVIVLLQQLTVAASLYYVTPTSYHLPMTQRITMKRSTAASVAIGSHSKSLVACLHVTSTDPGPMSPTVFVSNPHILQVYLHARVLYESLKYQSQRMTSHAHNCFYCEDLYDVFIIIIIIIIICLFKQIITSTWSFDHRRHHHVRLLVFVKPQTVYRIMIRVIKRYTMLVSLSVFRSGSFGSGSRGIK